MSRNSDHKIRLIPEGFYCYKILSIEQNPDPKLPPVIKTKTCPFWRLRFHKDGGYYGHCRFLKRGDESRHNPTMLLFDQCKECNLKIGDEE